MTSVDFQRARSADQQEQRRAAILTAARELLSHHTADDVSLRELSRRVGLSKSNVVRYFPSREAVFLAVLDEDWHAWLDDLERALPRVDRRRRPHTRHAAVAAAVARTLGEHDRFCALVAACHTVLERNIPVETARGFKTASLARGATLAGLVRAAVPELDEPGAVEFSGLVWALTAGVWPIAHPNPTVTEVLTEPALAGLCVEFVPAMTHALTVFLDGLAAS